MFHRLCAQNLIAAAVLTCAAAAANATTYDFGAAAGSGATGTVVTPYTISGATFSSPTDPGAFTFGPNIGLYSTLGAYVLSSAGTAATLDIAFATAQTGISFDSAMGDFLQFNGSDAITLTTNTGFSETLNPVIPGGSGDLFPQIAFTLAALPAFTSVAISATDAGGAESLTIADLATTPVPLPASVLLLLGGLGGVAGFARRRTTAGRVAAV